MEENRLKSILKRIIACCVIALFAFGPVACKKEGPAEQAGKKIDDACDAAKKKMKEATD